MNKDIKNVATDVLQTLEMWRIPVDPFAIAKAEEIEVASGSFGDGFDGRIKYLKEIGRFVIFYACENENRSRGRVRFTIAHELGHYYLHKNFLVSGQFHDSASNFRSEDAIEREADEFAANLLLPEPLFIKEVKEFRLGLCTLKELSKLAVRFQTSLTSTVRRYCQLSIEPSSMVMSKNGRLLWAVHSEDMSLDSEDIPSVGLNFVDCRNKPPVPPRSRTFEVVTSSKDYSEGAVEASVWFGKPYRNQLWEEAMALGKTGLVLTYLTTEV